MKAGEILTEAAKIVEGSRQQTHGDKERSFGTIATLWNAYLLECGAVLTEKSMLTPTDVAHMMMLLKLARAIIGNADPDHWVDMAGYAGLAGELSTTSTD